MSMSIVLVLAIDIVVVTVLDIVVVVVTEGRGNPCYIPRAVR